MFAKKNKKNEEYNQKMKNIEYVFKYVNKINTAKSKTFFIEKKDLLVALLFLKENRFNLLIDLFALDYPEMNERHEIVYVLLSIELNKRVILKVKLSEGEEIVSCTEIFSVAGWFEREVYDMNGVTFSGNTDLRRILTDYNFEGHPMLKDFPLSGYKEVRYDLDSKRVTYGKVNLTQDYRNFDFLSPWEGTVYKRNT